MAVQRMMGLSDKAKRRTGHADAALLERNS